MYQATKIGIQYLSESLRSEAQGKIKVTTIKPTGFPRTGLMSTVIDGMAGSSAVSDLMGSYIKENYVKDKVIIITGASAGFGRETAIKAAALGAKVVLAARREERLREITEGIIADGGEATYIKTDIRCKDEVYLPLANNSIITFCFQAVKGLLCGNNSSIPLSKVDEFSKSKEGLFA